MISTRHTGLGFLFPLSAKTPFSTGCARPRGEASGLRPPQLSGPGASDPGPHEPPRVSGTQAEPCRHGNCGWSGDAEAAGRLAWNFPGRVGLRIPAATRTVLSTYSNEDMGSRESDPAFLKAWFSFREVGNVFSRSPGCGARPNRLLSRHAAPRRSGCGRGPQKMCAGRPLPQNGEGETGHATQRAEPRAAPRPLPCPGSAQAAVTAAPGTVFIPFSGFTDIQLTKIVYTIFYKPLLLKCSR